MYGPRHILVLYTLHDGESPQLTADGLVVAIEDVEVLLLGADNITFEDTDSNILTDLSPLIACIAFPINEELPLIGAIDKTECRPALRAERHYEELAVLACHFIDDERVWIRKIEVVERLLPLLRADAKTLFVGIVEEEDGAEDCRFANSLRTYEMDVAVEVDLGVLYIGTVYENYLIQVSHC